jgi:hypothetical protein
MRVAHVDRQQVDNALPYNLRGVHHRGHQPVSRRDAFHHLTSPIALIGGSRRVEAQLLRP